jgi:tRNA modification GTPase
VLWVVDLSEAITEEDRQIGERLRGRPFLVVANKADLPARLDPRELAGPDASVVRTVAPTGEGIDALEEAIAERLLGAGVTSEDVLVSNARHRARLESAATALRQAIATVQTGFEQAMVAVDVKIAAEALGEITGESVTEATISEIFARFCVGK